MVNSKYRNAEHYLDVLSSVQSLNQFEQVLMEMNTLPKEFGNWVIDNDPDTMEVKITNLPLNESLEEKSIVISFVNKN